MKCPQYYDRISKYACQLHQRGIGYEEATVLVLEKAKVCWPPFPQDEAIKCLGSAWGYAVPVNFNRTDYGNAERLVARYGADIRYCCPWKKWLIWTGTHWAIDKTGEVERFAKDTVRQIYREAADEYVEEQRKKIVNHAKQSEYQRAIKAMINLAESEEGVVVLPSEFDTNPMLFNVQNGVINLERGRLRPHDKENLITKISPVIFDPEAESPLWEQFMDTITGGNPNLIKFIQRAVGYSMTAHIFEQSLFFLYGTGANGKSTFLEVIRYVMGDYAQQSDFSTFFAKPNNSINNDLARLRGSRFCSAVEAGEGKKFDEVVIKQATGGDKLTARFLYQEYFEFDATFKIWFEANHKPEISGTDHAIWRRIHLIPFTVTIPESDQDKKLTGRLKAEASGILNWCLEGCSEWLDYGLGLPDEVRGATAGYRQEMDVLAHFIDDICTVKQRAKVRVEELYLAYKEWCSRGGEKELSKNLFGMKLKERGFEKRRGTKGYYYWFGITMVDEDNLRK